MGIGVLYPEVHRHGSKKNASTAQTARNLPRPFSVSSECDVALEHNVSTRPLLQQHRQHRAFKANKQAQEPECVHPDGIYWRGEDQRLSRTITYLVLVQLTHCTIARFWL